ncbi:MAG: hypothetical protein J2P36_11600 [Ktedonobacteraceae bacterium]|nr:hypothetical protein [Ktedonobacteraceae bacterium]
MAAMNTPEIVRTLLPIVEVLEQLGVSYHLGGSVASSLHGIARPTLDIDLVADLQLFRVHLFVQRLGATYYVSEDAVRDAIRRRASFNVISNDLFMKVDIFIPKAHAFDQDAFRDVRQGILERSGRAFSIASPETTILHKLEWFKMGGGVSHTF